MKKSALASIFLIACLILSGNTRGNSNFIGSDSKDFNPATLLWYTAPAEKWEEALPVGNGRLGAMVFGKSGEERIQINEETYWSGGPYSTVVKGGAEYLPEIQKLIFAGEPLKAHKLFGRHLMGYPVEQQKYQSLANLHLFFEGQYTISDYKRWLDLQNGTTSVEFIANNIKYRRDVFVSAPDQVLVIRLTADKKESISFRAQLRGCRNSAHSNYATDYFRMDGTGNSGLVLTGKSADYMGVEGKIRYKAQLKATAEDGSVEVNGDELVIKNASAVTLYIVAATNFINYKNVNANQEARVQKYLDQIKNKSYQQIYKTAIADYQNYFTRVSLNLPVTKNSWLPTDERMSGLQETADPNMAALCYNFARFVLISSSRPGTEAANLQGIWNEDMNPSWDSKYTTNINLEMNYWPAETGNLSDCAEPLITLVKELTDQGSQVAREHYGADGWVFHQNTDLWRVAAPMDGPCWGTFTTGGAWLTTQLYEHYLFNPDLNYLKEIYPVIKGAVEFFMDFLVEEPGGKWLVTNPSNSPENPPEGPGYTYFYDEVTGMYYFTTICYGSSIDMQIIHDLFSYYVETEELLKKDPGFASKVKTAQKRLLPPRVGKDGTLQEWAEDYGQLEDKHRHFSHMYGLYPGNVISAKRTPKLAEPCKAVLEQRGDGGTGFSRGWKMALWARLYDGNRANKIFKGYIAEQCYPQLFAKCFTPLQIDGTMGVAAGITEMLVQSHEGKIDLLPALPGEWSNGRFDGVCARGGFELDLTWKDKTLTELEVLSKSGKTCHLTKCSDFRVTQNGKKVHTKHHKDGTLEFETMPGFVYRLTR